MPKINDIGFSDYTPIKQKLYKALCLKELGAIKGIFEKYKSVDWKRKKVLIIDATSGNGRGSPLIVYDLITKTWLRKIFFKFVCIDINEENINELRYLKDQQIIPENIEWEIIRADNKHALDEIYKREQLKNNHWQFGWIYTDPSGNVPPFDILKTFTHLRQFHPLDQIINIPTTTLLRVACAPHCRESRRLNEFLDEFGKNFWWINNTPHGRHRWVMCFGSNWNGWKIDHIGMENRYRFIESKSEEGKDLIRILSATKKEIKDGHFRSLQV